MGYTLEQLLRLEDPTKEINNLENPYEELGTADKLAEHRKLLNSLEAKDKLNLATKMILACPINELGNFSHAIEALREPADDTETFHEVLSQAFRVRKLLETLLDPRNKNPHRALLPPEFEDGPLNNFNALAVQVLDNKEKAIAEALATSTPARSRSRVSQNISNLFPLSPFSTKVQAVFTLTTNIEKYLLGKNPERFFINNLDFNPDICREYTKVLVDKIKGHENEIGDKLGCLDKKTRGTIATLLERIEPHAFEQDSPCKRISSAMDRKAAQIALESAQQGSSCSSTSNATDDPDLETTSLDATSEFDPAVSAAPTRTDAPATAPDRLFNKQQSAKPAVVAPVKDSSCCGFTFTR